MKMRMRIYIVALLILQSFLFLVGCGKKEEAADEIVLRVSNWEEYIDEGGWGEDEVIELSDGTVIHSESDMISDFEDWFYEEYGRKVRVEYSTFGTNEDLYNQLTLGDVFDVVCPSDYMIMKMMTEDMLEPFSVDFNDANNEHSYYARNVSPYIKDQFDNMIIGDEPISKYSAGYMWGTTGIVYNPEFVTEEEASHWDILSNRKFYKQITIKDSVREAFFAGMAIYKFDELTSDEMQNSSNYYERLSDALNDTNKESVDSVEEILSDIQKNVYSFETDAGKADMVTGKVVANQQWSGDAVYTMDQADEDGVELYFSTPLEATNLWFDAWCMLKSGIGDDPDKKMAAEAFINYMALPENAIRNMYYIGYTSTVSGGESNMIMDYISYNYEADDDEEETIDYDISYFFGRDAVFNAPKDAKVRQLGAQYPTKDITDRSVIFRYFDEEGNERMNRMWTNVRCFDLNQFFN